MYAYLLLLCLLVIWQRYRPLYTHTHTHRSTSEMAVTTYQSTWRNIPQDLYLSTKPVGTLVVYSHTKIVVKNNYPQCAINNVDTVTWQAIPTHNHPYFGFALSTRPQFTVRPLQRYRQHNKINKSIFPDIFQLNHVYTRKYTRTHTENLKFYRYGVLRNASTCGPSAAHTQPGSTARLATTPSAHNHNHIHTNGHTPPVGPRRTAGFEL